MHHPPRKQRQRTGNNERTKEQAHHRDSMCPNATLPGCKQGKGHRNQSPDRQQVDQTKWSELANGMDPERADRDNQHEQDPYPANQPVAQRPFCKHQLGSTKQERRKRQEGVDLNGDGLIKQRLQVHAIEPILRSQSILERDFVVERLVETATPLATTALATTALAATVLATTVLATASRRARGIAVATGVIA